MDWRELSIIYHIGLVLAVLWMAGSVGWSHSMLFFLAFFYLCMVTASYSVRLRRRLQYEETKSAYQKRLLSDAESARWLNHAIDKMWPICMEQIVSRLLSPIIPWFLDKFKPWTVSKAAIQELYMGRNPPMFTRIRVLVDSSDDDHLVLELGMNFLSAEDMNAVLAVQLNKSIGLGMTTNMHLTGMHVEGKILVGVKFIRRWPFLGRVRLCFVEPPYFQMTVKPLISHGLDVTELPGISGWLDKLMDTAFGQTLVEPNMLVIDVEKFSAAPAENDWFSIKERPPIAYVNLEILEGADMKPSDLNGLADPYVKGRLGPCMFQTKIKRKTLAPKWLEEFKIPITSWEASNELVLEVRDKDPMFDDSLGECSIKINELRGGQRHDKWLSLRNVKKGRIHLAITIEDVTQAEGKDVTDKVEISNPSDIIGSADTVEISEGKQTLMDELEPIKIDGQEQAAVYVHRPGSGVPRTWESRKGRARNPETQIYQEVDMSKETSTPKDGNKRQQTGNGQGGLFNLGFMFRRHSNKESSQGHDQMLPPTPHSNVKELQEKRTSVKIVADRDSNDSSGSEKEKSETLTEDTGSRGKILTSAVSRRSSKNKMESKLSESLEKDELHGSDLPSDEPNDGPVLVEGSPIVADSTLECGNETNPAGEDGKSKSLQT